MGNFWIGGKLIVIQYEEEIENYMDYFINNVLPGGLTLWREKAAFSGQNLDHKLRFDNGNIVLQVYRKGKYLTYGDLRYETFTEDLRTFMDGKLQQYINA